MLCNMLGRLFEPYIVHIIQHLLLCFGDGNQYVREVGSRTHRHMPRMGSRTHLHTSRMGTYQTCREAIRGGESLFIS